MQPYGRRKIKHNYEDHHFIKKETCNWWEDNLNMVNKKKERQKSKREIKKELESLYG